MIRIAIGKLKMCNKGSTYPGKKTDWKNKQFYSYCKKKKKSIKNYNCIPNTANIRPKQLKRYPQYGSYPLLLAPSRPTLPQSSSHAVSGGPLGGLTSWRWRGSIMGASSPLGERAGDEHSLFSHSVMPGLSAAVSRKERLSLLMLLWCCASSSGGSVS